jgi:hypothetical protein
MPIHLNKLKGKGSVNQIPLLAKSSTKKGNVSTSQLKVKSKCPMALQDRERPAAASIEVPNGCKAKATNAVQGPVDPAKV